MILLLVLIAITPGVLYFGDPPREVLIVGSAEEAALIVALRQSGTWPFRAYQATLYRVRLDGLERVALPAVKITPIPDPLAGREEELSSALRQPPEP